ncbi:hypothetical protein PHISCL_06508 [Aspergillus sclerotialis]|uniref:Uncharacterized protein n=1 Tax=Aspergillus sclerotialis TaxID=2070753 RepID=A0A3A2ZFX1_9EURO|nr:hypothetical protein PHISCL_06508 [Aspergillus sclerotialis]
MNHDQHMNQLRNAARAFLEVLQTTRALADKIPGFENIRVGTIGGLAVGHYIANRTTYVRSFPLQKSAPTDLGKKDIDIVISSPAEPKHVVDILKKEYPEVFIKRADIFFMEFEGRSIQVDLIPPEVLPYTPSGLIPIGLVNLPFLPYVGILNTLVSKAYCCGARASKQKNEQDAKDVIDLIDKLTGDRRPISVTPCQGAIIWKGLEYIAKHGNRSQGWVARWFNVQALLSQTASKLKVFGSRDEDENFEKALKLQVLKEFLCPKSLHIT